MRTVGWFLLVVVIAAAAVGGGYAWFVFSGRFDIAATKPHWPGVRRAIEGVVDASVQHHAAGIEVPQISADRVAAGALAYSESCATCHGAPGIDRLAWAKGMLPEPPHLSREPSEYTLAETFWIIDKGIKMSGMPSWEGTLSEQEMWTIAALVERLPQLSAAEYQQMLATAARAEVPASADTGAEGDTAGSDATASAAKKGGSPDAEAAAR